MFARQAGPARDVLVKGGPVATELLEQILKGRDLQAVGGEQGERSIVGSACPGSVTRKTRILGDQPLGPWKGNLLLSVGMTRFFFR